MAAKRASFLGKLEKELPEQPKVASAPEPRSATPLNKADILKSTIYLNSAAHERLREIAYTERVKMHDLFLEGIDRVLESRGHSERATDKKPS